MLCYYLVVGKHASDRKGLLQTQISLTFFLDFTAFLVVFLKTFDFKVAVFYAEMMVYFAAILILYRRIYKNASMLLLNNMCMLLSVGFIMLCWLDIASANKQLLIVACGRTLPGSMQAWALSFWQPFLCWPRPAMVRSFPLWAFSPLR